METWQLLRNLRKISCAIKDEGVDLWKWAKYDLGTSLIPGDIDCTFQALLSQSHRFILWLWPWPEMQIGKRKNKFWPPTDSAIAKKVNFRPRHYSYYCTFLGINLKCCFFWLLKLSMSLGKRGTLSSLWLNTWRWFYKFALFLLFYHWDTGINFIRVILILLLLLLFLLQHSDKKVWQRLSKPDHWWQVLSANYCSNANNNFASKQFYGQGNKDRLSHWQCLQKSPNHD